MPAGDDKPKEFVTYRGDRMIAGWPEKILEAQAVTHYQISGKAYPRIPYGNEPDDWGANEHACGDCRVVKGELHVVGCDVEHCPKCLGQAITCDCLDETDGG